MLVQGLQLRQSARYQHGHTKMGDEKPSETPSTSSQMNAASGSPDATARVNKSPRRKGWPGATDRRSAKGAKTAQILQERIQRVLSERRILGARRKSCQDPRVKTVRDDAWAPQVTQLAKNIVYRGQSPAGGALKASTILNTVQVPGHGELGRQERLPVSNRDHIRARTVPEPENWQWRLPWMRGSRQTSGCEKCRPEGGRQPGGRGTCACAGRLMRAASKPGSWSTAARLCPCQGRAGRQQQCSFIHAMQRGSRKVKLETGFSNTMKPPCCQTRCRR